MSRCRTITSVVVLAGWFSLAGVGIAAAQDIECATTSSVESDLVVAGCNPDCPAKGDCDCPARRDLWNPGAPGGTPITVRVKISVFDDEILGSPDPDAIINAQIDKIVDDFDAWKIDLQVPPAAIIGGSPFGSVFTFEDVSAMKAAHADSPGTQLNVYVTDIQIDEDILEGVPDFIGKATLPWEPDATGTQGGIIIDGGAFGLNKTTLTHEIGHALGLWHTHHGGGTGELILEHGGCGLAPPCDCVCYELADGTDCDLTGDFCCDTPSTPVNSDCNPPGGSDPCSTFDWGPTDFDNFMGFASDVTVPPCRDHFTDQQARRLHCWACDKLAGWIVGAGSPGACCTGDGQCLTTPQICCDEVGGSFLGTGVSCDQGACCMGDGSCQFLIRTEGCCINAGGTFLAGVSNCVTDCDGNVVPNVCQGAAACCDPLTGECTDTTQSCCQAQGGLFRANLTCAMNGTGRPVIIVCTSTQGPGFVP